MSLQPTGAPPAMTWARRYPERWRREIADLEATGWVHRFSDDAETLHIDYPVSAPPAVAGVDELTSEQESAPPGDGYDQETPVVGLTVWFPAEYPFFPPRVADTERALRLRRHTNGDGALCLIERDDWRMDTTVAELLGTQMPRLLHAATDETEPEPGIEVRAAEPVGLSLSGTVGGVALIMPAWTPPAHTGEGALVVRYALRAGDLIGAGLVDRILGEHIDVPGPAPLQRRGFPLVSYGRWARDPEFNRDDTPAATYERLQQRLAPLRIDEDDPDDGDDTSGVDTSPGGTEARLPVSFLETLCLLVPGERDYRQPGEEWVAVRRVDLDDHRSCHYLQVQQLDAQYLPRVPQSTVLADRHVVVVGLGAVGGHVAIDLARTGLGRIDLVDGDDVDITTASRQYAPLVAAGRNKAEALAGHLALTNPHTTIRCHQMFVGSVALTPSARQRRHRLSQALRAADLVIDATADPAATGYLAAVRQALGRDFLHLSATAGAWGGCVFLATPDTGCWACLQHHRADRTVPAPSADPDGIITPPGCAEATFTGTNPDLALIAHHASRVAIDRLTGGHGLGGDLYVAHLRDPHGAPRPSSWEAADVPVHPTCPLHADADAGHAAPSASPTPPVRRRAGTAPRSPRPTIPQQPREGEADGHSPPGAPIPATQER